MKQAIQKVRVEITYLDKAGESVRVRFDRLNNQLPPADLATFAERVKDAIMRTMRDLL